MLLNCKINTPITKNDCSITIAGVKDLAFLSWNPTIANLLGANTDCPLTQTEITAGVSTENFYEVQPADQSAGLSASIVVGSNKDSKAIMHSVSGQINSVTCDLLGDEFKNLALGAFIIAVLNKNGTVLLYGVDNGLTASTFEYTTGTADADAVGINFVFDGLQYNAPLAVVNWAAIENSYPSPTPPPPPPSHS